MLRSFVLITDAGEREVARKAYMSLEQAFRGFNKCAREQFTKPEWVNEPEQMFTGYWRDAETKHALLMR